MACKFQIRGVSDPAIDSVLGYVEVTPRGSRNVEDIYKALEDEGVLVFDPDHPLAHPDSEWKPATVIEICEDGDVAVRYAPGDAIDGFDEEEVAVDELRLVSRSV